MLTVDDFVIEEYLDSKVSKEYYANKDEIKKGIQKILDVHGERIDSLLRILRDGETIYFWANNIPVRTHLVFEYEDGSKDENIRSKATLCVIIYKGFANYEEKIEDEVEIASDFSLSSDTVASYTIKRR